ncbi:UvrD-helicase domain-containing protein, partial [Pseudomonas aeruginosa]
MREQPQQLFAQLRTGGVGEGNHCQPLARIFAGAGSGKSTTLVLRVVFMLCHLGVEPQRLTVISFTNASCTQLREQLLRLLAHWQYPFDAAQ